MSGFPFNVIDLSFISILVISGILAYLRGFVRETLSVVAWVGATFATLYGYRYLEPYARQLIENRIIADVSAGLLLFVATLTVLTVAAHFASRKVRDSAAGGFDRSMGFVFGLVRGVVLVCLLFLSATWFWGRSDLPKSVLQARTYPLIEGSTEMLLAMIPDNARQTAQNATGIGQAKDKATSSERTLRNLLAPKPAPGKITDFTGDSRTRGYGRVERSEMQRLIESKE